MDKQLSSKKALEDLSTIKKTIDRATGASIFTNFIFSTGTLLAISGVIVIIGCIVNFYVISAFGFTAEIKRAMIIMWVVILLVIGTAQFIIFAKRSKQHNMSLFSYYKKIANKSFLQIDIPLEILCTVFIIFFLKIGHPEYILSTCVLWIAVLFTSLGSVFVERSFTIVGYIYLFCGAVGLLFMSEVPLLYTVIVFGLLSIILGLLMHLRYKQLKEEHIAENRREME